MKDAKAQNIAPQHPSLFDTWLAEVSDQNIGERDRNARDNDVSGSMIQ
jgi:hypothetical protein